MLSLAEELLLLALDDRKDADTWTNPVAVEYGLIGAVLLDLVLRSRLGVRDGKLVVVDSNPTGDDILDEALGRIAGAIGPYDPVFWIGKLKDGIRGLHGRVLSRLVAMGLVESEEHRLLWIVPTQNQPMAGPGVKREVRERVRCAVLDGVEPDARTAALLSLVQAAGLVDDVFLDIERRAARRRLKELARDKVIAGLVADSTGSTSGAAFVAITAALMAAASAAPS